MTERQAWFFLTVAAIAVCLWSAVARADSQKCVWKVCKELNKKPVQCGPLQYGYSSDVVALIAADQGGQAIVFECGPDEKLFKMVK